jgi:hypothetical protein
MAGMPCVEELVRRLIADHAAVEVEYGPRRTASVHFSPAQSAHRITLRTSETELGAAVTTIGEECRDVLSPDRTVESAGFDLLLVHLDEVIATRDTTEPLRITADGLQWPGARRRHRGHRR